MSFSLDLTRWAGQLDNQLDVVLQKVAIEILSRIVEKTPVDSGRARANWQVSLNVVPGGYDDDAFDKSGGTAISKGQAEALKAQAEDSVYIVNNAPYILKLEEGSSTQAPSGMVTITVQEFTGIVAGAANNVR
ncbi:HK97 gp10 family phage protein [Escherichia coli]|uniref:HK97 gp10 family phage protein n=1 Tax=Escherichia coli TaxID=562 RepID=UPI000E21185C|nr:HK97 gp10 family phage protein [Escherichia coli]